MSGNEHTANRSGLVRKLVLFTAIVLVVLLVAFGVRHSMQRISESQKAALPRDVGRNAPFITSQDVVIDRMIELADLSEDELVYDLGCGDGRILIAAVQQSGCRGVGFDIDPDRVNEARANAKQQGVDQRVEFVRQDIFTVDLSKADVAMMYLLPWMMNKLVPQFDKMRPGCRIVSHEFWIEGVEPDKVIECTVDAEQRSHGIYFYTTPLKKNPAMEPGTPPRPDNLVPLKRKLRSGQG
jgi:SAM-dependent methyltransferase